MTAELPFKFVFVSRVCTAGLAIVLLVYGSEELATVGRMSQAAFQAAATTSRIDPGNWARSLIVIFTVFGKNIGLLAFWWQLA